MGDRWQRCFPPVACRWSECSRSVSRWPKRCRRHIKRGSPTAISSPPTSCSVKGITRVASRFSTSGSRKPLRRTQTTGPDYLARRFADIHVAGEDSAGRHPGHRRVYVPEQAEGRAVDARSDLFSLGVILYEMATGQRPFNGETSISILSSVLKDTPRSVAEINPTLPAELSRIIRRALAKDPERRYQDAKDLRNDLEELSVALHSGELVPAPRRTLSRGVLPQLTKPARAIAAAIVLATALAAFGFATWRRQAPSDTDSDRQAPPVPSLAELQVTQLTTTGNAERPAISPDGRFVAYVQHEGADFSLWIRQTANTSLGQIVPPAPGVELLGATFTPDGMSVDYLRRAAAGGTAEVWRVPFSAAHPA